MEHARRKSEGAGSPVEKGYPSSREVEVFSPSKIYLPASAPAGKLGTFCSAQTQKTRVEELLTTPDRFSSVMVDF